MPVIFCVIVVLFLSGAVMAGEKQPMTASASCTQPGAIMLTEEALRIHRSGLLIDGHNDMIWQIRTKGGASFDKMDIRQRQDAIQTDIPRLRQGGVGGQFWAVYVPPELKGKGESIKVALEEFDLIDEMTRRYSDVFELARTADDVERIHKSGKIAALIGLEGGHMIENSLKTLERYYARGARYLGLTHSENCDWADSATDTPRNNGLSPFGEKVILELNRLGMLVDLAHVSPDTMRGVLRISKAPVIFSHATAMVIAQHPRNVPDDVIRSLKSNGGVLMVTFFPGYADPEGAKAMAGYFEKQRELKSQYPDKAEYEKAWKEWRSLHPVPKGTVGTVVDHIDYIVKVAGIDHVGLGSDYDGVSIMPVHLEDVSGYPYITQELLNRGYSAQDIHKIMGQNILRVLRAAERTAREWKK